MQAILEQQETIELINNLLSNRDLCTVGQFGKWEYLNMDNFTLEGTRVAEEITSVLKG